MKTMVGVTFVYMAAKIAKKKREILLLCGQ